MKKHLLTTLLVMGACLLTLPLQAGNPVIKDRFTADPAALVHKGKAYLYVGHDEAAVEGDFFVMNEWLIYSSDDMVNWELAGSFPRSAFRWARRPTAWASQAVERDGKFYWYVTVLNDAPEAPEKNGFAIGVAVSESPTEGFRDALGKPLVRSDMTEAPDHMHAHETWDNIDPTVFIEDGEAYLYWGNSHLYYAKLKDNMIELDGDIHQVQIEDQPGVFTEGPFLHQHNDTYYMTYAMDYPEKIAYATSDSITGPWRYRGLLLDVLPDTGTSHPAVLEFEDEWYFIYHTAALPTGGNYRRSVSIEKFEHNPDGSIDQLKATASGVAHEPFRIELISGDHACLGHLDGRPVIGDPENRKGAEAADFAWHIVPGLAGTGDGSISFQAENLPGFYLKRSRTGLVELAKHDGTDEFREGATFEQVDGLAAGDGSSFTAIGESDRYLTGQSDGSLKVQTVEPSEHSRATFRLRQGAD